MAAVWGKHFESQDGMASAECNRSHAGFKAEGVRLRFAANVEMDETGRVRKRL